MNLELLDKKVFNAELEMLELEGYDCREKFEKQLNEFFNCIKMIGDKVKNIDNFVFIEINILNGRSQEDTFVLRLTPFVDFKDDEYLVGFWKDDSVDEEAANPMYCFNPGFKNNISEDDEIIYINPLSFVFLQLYDKKDDIYKKFEESIITQLNSRLEFINKRKTIIEKINNKK